MKNLSYSLFFLLILLFLAACSPVEKEAAEVREAQKKTSFRLIQKDNFYGILDAAKLEGTLLVFDLEKNAYYFNDTEAMYRRELPASTFKIPNSIIALETGVIKDQNTILPWNGEKRRMKIWEKEMNFQEGFRKSCLPCYRVIADSVGFDKMQDWLEKLEYGKMEFSQEDLNLFWVKGNSTISPLEQVDFLARFYEGRLPISSRTVDIVKQMMFLEETTEYTLYGKTGWGVVGEKNNGWFVGFLEAKGKTYFFATNVHPKSDFDMKDFAKIRSSVTMEALRELSFSH